MTALRATELECEATIIDAAKLFGWRVHGERPAVSRGWSTPIKGDPGWPDLVLARPGRLLIVELKRKPNRVEPAQQVWLDLLSTIPGVQTQVVWVPEELDALCALLAAANRPAS